MKPEYDQQKDLPKKAVSYVRISSRKQAKEGDGLRSQSRSLEDYARYKGMEVVEIFSDVISGKYASRPGMDAMLEFLRDQPDETYAVLVHDIARLARDIVSHTALRAEISAAGGVLMSPSIEFSDDPVAQLPEKLQAVIVEHERLSNARRAASRQRARMLNGYWTLAPGPAYEYVAAKGHNGKLLVRREPIASVLADALNGFASGRIQTQSELRRFLQNHPDYPKGKSGKVPKQNIRRLLVNKLHAGYLEYQPWDVPLTKAAHEPIISYETYLKIQERLDGKPKFPIRKSINPDFPLRGCVDCANCEKPMKAGWTTGRSKRYAYYVCQTKGCSSYGESTPKAEIEGSFDKILVKARIRPEILRIVEKMVHKAWKLNKAEADKQKRVIQGRLRQIEEQIDRYLKMLLDVQQASVVAAYESKIAELENERVVKKEKLAAFDTQKGRKETDFERAYRTVMNFIEKPHELWRSGRIECQRAAVKYLLEDRLKWCRKHGYRTAQLSLPFRQLGEAMIGEMGQNKNLVGPEGLEPPTKRL